MWHRKNTASPHVIVIPPLLSRIEHRTLCMLSRHSTAELHSQPLVQRQTVLFITSSVIRYEDNWGSMYLIPVFSTGYGHRQVCGKKKM